MRQIYLRLRTPMNEQTGVVWYKYQAYDITLVALKDEADFNQKKRDGHPLLELLHDWSPQSDQKRAFDLARWWCEDHKYGYINTLENRPIPPALALMQDAGTLAYDHSEEPGSDVHRIWWTANNYYQALVSYFADDIAQAPDDVEFAFQHWNEYQQAIDHLQGAQQQLMRAYALKYLRANPIPLEKMVELVRAYREGNRFLALTQTFSHSPWFNINVMKPFFYWLSQQARLAQQADITLTLEEVIQTLMESYL